MNQQFLNSFREALEMEAEDELNATDKFRDLEAWDSLARLSLIAMLDDEYAVEIEEDAFEKLDTVEDIFNYVQENRP